MKHVSQGDNDATIMIYFYPAIISNTKIFEKVEIIEKSHRVLLQRQPVSLF